MVRHCVFFRFRDDVDAGERRAIHRDLSALREVVPGMGAVQFGENNSPEPFSNGFQHGFMIDFDTDAARDAYLVHELHQAAGARLVAAIEGGTSKLMVFDLVF
jgi:hypothetical protein